MAYPLKLQVITVPGKAFPVTDLYLEDLLDRTGHRIAVGSECALRPERVSGGGRAKVSYSVGRGNTATTNVEWGEGGAESMGGINEWYPKP